MNCVCGGVATLAVTVKVMVAEAPGGSVFDVSPMLQTKFGLMLLQVTVTPGEAVHEDDTEVMVLGSKS